MNSSPNAFKKRCEIYGIFDIDVVKEASSMMYRRIKADNSVKKRVLGFIGFDVLDINKDHVVVIAYASDKNVLNDSKKMNDFAVVVSYALKMEKVNEIIYNVDLSGYIEDANFVDKEMMMLLETENDRRDVFSNEERRMNCFMFDVYYRVVFSKPMCKEMMTLCKEIEEMMISRRYCEQLKLAAFEKREDVGYVRLTLKAFNAEDAAAAAYERDSLLAFVLNSYLQNKVDDLIVANAVLMEEEGLIPSRLFSLLDDNKPLVLPPYSLPCGECQEKDCAFFGVHLLYRDYDRYDWQWCLTSAFGPPIFYSPRVGQIFVAKNAEKTVKDAVKDATMDIFKTPKKKR